jgi:tRNA dimethylallyltransferase
MALVPRRLLAIVGPTASGKSALALRLAEVVPAEIVSCDSLQVYRGLDIGSAKPTAEERGRVPHHLLDLADPDEGFSAARYAQSARRAIAEIAARGRVPIVVGGSGLYLRALLEGLFPGPSRDDALRQRLEGIAKRFGDARLHRLLGRVDPEAACRIAVRDRVRVVRAIEVFALTGRPLSVQQGLEEKPLAGYATLLVGLALPRATLRVRVIERTHEMLRAGLIDEVRGLVAKGYGRTRALDAIGYRQARHVVEGTLTVTAAEHEIVTQTMRYAKRQMTWFRHQASVAWFADAEAAFCSDHAWLSNETSERSTADPPSRAGAFDAEALGE